MAFSHDEERVRAERARAIGLFRSAQIAAILRAHSGWSPDERTLQRNLVRLS
jgi:hypothetical protein